MISLWHYFKDKCVHLTPKFKWKWIRKITFNKNSSKIAFYFLTIFRRNMTLTCFLRCTHNMFECLLVYQAQSTRCLLRWSLTLFVQSLTLHSPRANQAHSNLKWKNRLLFWRNLLPGKLPFGCQVLVVLCAKAVITEWVSECRILPPHLSTNYSQQMLVRGGSFWLFRIWCSCSVDACSFSPAVQRRRSFSWQEAVNLVEKLRGSIVLPWQPSLEFGAVFIKSWPEE